MSENPSNELTLHQSGGPKFGSSSGWEVTIYKLFTVTSALILGHTSLKQWIYHLPATPYAHEMKLSGKVSVVFTH